MEEYNKGWLHRIGETQTMDYSEVVEKEEEINNIPPSIIFRDGQKFINLLKQSKGGVIYYTPEGKYSEFKKEFEMEFESWKTGINNLSYELKIESIEDSKDLLQEFIVNENKDNIIDLYRHYYNLIVEIETTDKNIISETQKKELKEVFSALNNTKKGNKKSEFSEFNEDEFIQIIKERDFSSFGGSQRLKGIIAKIAKITGNDWGKDAAESIKTDLAECSKRIGMFNK